MQKIIVRHDDFDFRLKTEEYIAIHEKFIKRNLIETAVVQYTKDGRERVYDKELIEYMNTAPNWDIQLHGWAHDEYDKLTQSEIADALQNSLNMSMKLFNKYPTVWYPPWNRRNEDMEIVAEAFGLTISNESYDISKFIRESRAGVYKGTSIYFHGWKADEMACLDEALNCVEEVNFIGGAK